MKLVRESLNQFERGTDPKTSLGIGRAGKIRNLFRSFDISDEDYVITPNEVLFNTDLDLEKKSITWLPDGLKIHGKLNLQYTTTILELPNGLEVYGSMWLLASQITKLPNNLKVHSRLSIAFTPITELPIGLKILGELYLNNTVIAELPDDLEVNKFIFVNHKQKELINFINNSKFINKLRVL